MRIVVVGAGKLGFSVAELLPKEGYDVVVIDPDEKRLEAVQSSLDVLTIAKSGASPLTFRLADVYGADILLSATKSDEVNMLACILAKHHDISHTIARIRDIQWLAPDEKDFLKRVFDIDVLLNPELITAREIYRTLMLPAALNVDDYADGKVRLYETLIKDDSAIVNKTLKDIDLPPSILAGMIFRNHEMIIPHGDDYLRTGDHVYFVGTPAAIETFSKELRPRDAHRLQKVIIVGAGRTGRFLAKMLAEDKILVKIFDIDIKRCNEAAEFVKEAIVIHGDATKMDLLLEEQIAEADVLVSVTQDDKLNLMLSLLGKHLGVKKAIVRVAREEYSTLMEKVGVDIAFSPRMLAVNEILSFIRRGGVLAVSRLEEGKAEVVEVLIKENAPLIGTPLKDLNLPRQCLICARVHEDSVEVPNGDTIFAEGDRAIVFIRHGYSKEVMSFLR